VDCSVCGEWGWGVLQYPSVDATTLGKDLARHLISAGRWQRSKPVTVEAFEKIRQKLAPVLGPDRPIEPGACFGPLQGRGDGMFPDFVWVGISVLVRESVFSAMREAGFPLTGVPAGIKFRKQSQESLIELEARPTARLHPSAWPRTCEVCGQNLDSRPNLLLDAKSYDDSIPLQRVLCWPNWLIGSQAFAEFVRARKFNGCVVMPAELK
jgi:uncharacterized double-CXXCG motif protein